MPWLQGSDENALKTFAEMRVLPRIVYNVLRRNGVTGEGGDSKRLLSDYAKLLAAHALWSDRLGLNPTARLELRAAEPRSVEMLDLESFRSDGDKPDDGATAAATSKNGAG
jgi:hypothetical protein